MAQVNKTGAIAPKADETKAAIIVQDHTDLFETSTKAAQTSVRNDRKGYKNDAAIILDLEDTSKADIMAKNMAKKISSKAVAALHKAAYLDITKGDAPAWLEEAKKDKEDKDQKALVSAYNAAKRSVSLLIENGVNFPYNADFDISRLNNIKKVISNASVLPALTRSALSKYAHAKAGQSNDLIALYGAAITGAQKHCDAHDEKLSNDLVREVCFDLLTKDQAKEVQKYLHISFDDLDRIYASEGEAIEAA